ncbi:predicted protein [Aspergillus nidulans FGSC A4]|nr:predicted protein [Aspergillus nidulans FGSC A4]|eukprot:XP_682295.1 predicted protein [Aspergillus nidulans FGSC A4]
MEPPSNSQTESAAGSPSISEETKRKHRKRRNGRTRVSKACCQAKPVGDKRGHEQIGANSGIIWAKRFASQCTDSHYDHCGQPLSPASTAPSRPQSTLPGEAYDENVRLNAFLDSESSLASRDEWNSWLEAFCREVHPQYPFLHLPTLKYLYTQLPDPSGLSGEHVFQNEEQRCQVSLVLVCLAIGCYCKSSYSSNFKGSCPGGWGIYSTAIDVYGNMMKTATNPSTGLLFTQTIVLMLLSLAISQLHCQGCHQRDTLSSIPVVRGEFMRRLWCSVYALDRELSIQTEDEFMIKDINVDFALPMNLGDTWMTIHYDDNRSSSDLADLIQNEILKRPTMEIPCLRETTCYARAASKTREMLCDKDTNNHHENSPLLIESLERYISGAFRTIVLAFHAENCQASQPSTEKQEIEKKGWSLRTIRWGYLRLLISLKALKRSKESDLPDSQASRFTCLHLIEEILLALNSLPHEFPKYTFPILHYWNSVVSIGLEMVAEEPLLRQFYGGTILEAVISLREFYSKTWLSSQMSQNILRMSYAARSIFADEIAEREGFLDQPRGLSSQRNMTAGLKKVPFTTSTLSPESAMNNSLDETFGLSSTTGAPGDVSIDQTTGNHGRTTANHSQEQNLSHISPELYIENSNGQASFHSQGAPGVPETNNPHHAESDPHILYANGHLGSQEASIVHDELNSQQLYTNPDSPVAQDTSGPGIPLNLSNSLDVHNRPDRFGSTLANETTQTIMSDSHISPGDQSFEPCDSGLSNALDCGIPELGLDENHLFTLSDAGLSPL